MTKKIKVLFIHHGKGIGGASMSLLYLVKNLPTDEYDPIVLFLEDSEAVLMFKNAGVKCLGPLNLSDFSHTVIWWYKWYHLKAFFRAVIDNFKVFWAVGQKLLESVGPDIVHLNTSSLFVWAMVAHMLKLPVVCHIREPLSGGYFGLRRAIVQLAVEKYSSAIVAISKNEALPWQFCPKTSVVYNAVPENFKALVVDNFPTENKTKEHRIIFLGGMSEQKGTLLILEAFQLLKNAGVKARLVIAGKFFYEESFFKKFLKITSFARYCSKVEKLVNQLQGSIDFKGVCTNVAKLINDCHVLVFPATEGHFARPIIEAGFCSRPVVATNLAPMNELVIDGKTGFLVPPNAELFAQKLLHILSDEKLAKKMGQANYNFCKKNFCLSVQLNKINRIYKNLV